LTSVIFKDLRRIDNNPVDKKSKMFRFGNEDP